MGIKQFNELKMVVINNVKYIIIYDIKCIAIGILNNRYKYKTIHIFPKFLINFQIMVIFIFYYKFENSS